MIITEEQEFKNAGHTWDAMVSLTMSSGLWRKVYRNTTPEAREARAVPTSAKAYDRKKSGKPVESFSASNLQKGFQMS